jgi:hypothetical protein
MGEAVMQMRFIGQVVFAAAIAASLPALAAGQNQDATFKGLAQSLLPQSHVLVMDRAGNEVFARVEAVLDMSLVVVTLIREERRNGTTVSTSDKRTFTPADVSSIAKADTLGRRGREIYLSPTAFGARMRQLKPGHKVTVVQMDGSKVTGRMRQVLESSIVVDPGGARPARTFAMAEIREVRGHDVLWDGPLWGAAIGLGLYFLATHDGDSCPCPSYVPIIAVPLTITVAAELVLRPATYYRAPSAPARLSIAPVVTNGRRGVMAVLRF